MIPSIMKLKSRKRNTCIVMKKGILGKIVYHEKAWKEVISKSKNVTMAPNVYNGLRP